MPALKLRGSNGIRGPRLIIQDARHRTTHELAPQFGCVPLARSPVEAPVAIFAAKGAQQHRTKYQINHPVTV